jgi:hypothetical protein
MATVSVVSRSALAVAGLVVAAALAAPAVAHNNGAFHTKGQAENNIAKVLILATIQNPKLGATLDTRVVCSGFGARRGFRYNHFFCTIRRPWKGARSLTYHAKRGGHYDVSL